MPAGNRETLHQTVEETHASKPAELPKAALLQQAFLEPHSLATVALLKPALDDDPADPHRNPVFELLVQGEGDVAGLLAYGLYKQNKRDWLIAFQANNGRVPEAAELAAFILAERIPRRIATYRRLAEDLLTRDGYKPGNIRSGFFGASLQPANDTGDVQSSLRQAGKKAQTMRYILGMLALVFAMAIVFRLAGTWLFG